MSPASIINISRYAGIRWNRTFLRSKYQKTLAPKSIEEKYQIRIAKITDKENLIYGNHSGTRNGKAQ